MSPSEVVAHFGTQSAAAKAIGISQPSVAMWVKRGRVPLFQQLRLQYATQKALTASPEIMPALVESKKVA